ncbi:Ras GTPase-activating protein-binding protein 2 [Varanus komodoensis]|nr:Ras GTPase-activating protein-binding protein 2 [Varanus komodoensis]
MGEPLYLFTYPPVQEEFTIFVHWAGALVGKEISISILNAMSDRKGFMAGIHLMSMVGWMPVANPRKQSMARLEDIEELSTEELAELQSEQQKTLAEEDSTEEEEDWEEVSSDVKQSIMKKWNECQDFFEKHHPNITDIHKKVMSLQFSECRTKIRHVDAHATLNDGVVVQVMGELTNNGQPMRKFMQTFVLAPEGSVPNKFYVHNDIFRYEDEVFGDSEGELDEVAKLCSTHHDPKDNIPPGLPVLNHPPGSTQAHTNCFSDSI